MFFGNGYVTLVVTPNIDRFFAILRHHDASCTTADTDMNSASYVESVTVGCFLHDHDVTPLWAKIMYSLVDLRSFGSD